MSILTANAPSAGSMPKLGSRIPPLDFLRSLSLEDKEELFVELLREVIAYHGGKGLIPVETPDGEWLGYFVPPEAAAARAEAALPKLTLEREAELARRQTNPGTTVSAQQLIAELNARADSLRTQTQ